ncbi:hypothetical protein BDZ91DRAFT_774084, partial [Kalaharituber pfeilii]
MNKQPKGHDKKKPKKPFYIKKADLRLDEYKQEIRDSSPNVLLCRGWDVLRKSRKFHLYLLMQAVAAFFGYGQPMLCIGILWMMYVNTGTRKEGDKSAYSLFNDNFEAIDGATNMQDIDRELRRQ